MARRRSRSSATGRRPTGSAARAVGRAARSGAALAGARPVDVDHDAIRVRERRSGGGARSARGRAPGAPCVSVFWPTRTPCSRPSPTGEARRRSAPDPDARRDRGRGARAARRRDRPAARAAPSATGCVELDHHARVVRIRPVAHLDHVAEARRAARRRAAAPTAQSAARAQRAPRHVGLLAQQRPQPRQQRQRLERRGALRIERAQRRRAPPARAGRAAARRPRTSASWPAGSPAPRRAPAAARPCSSSSPPSRLRRISPRALDHGGRQARQPRHLDAVGAARRARHQPPQEDHVLAPLAHREVGVAHARLRAREVGQLVVVGREQRARARAPGASCRCSATAQAIESPSKVLVPRPISSRITRLRAATPAPGSRPSRASRP